MKVLIVTPYFWPHPGGVESYTLNIAKELISQNWEVVVVTSSLAGVADKDNVQGIKVYRLKTLFSTSNTPIGWRWKAALKRIYSLEKPDIINGHMPVPYLADVAERSRGHIPFVLTYHNDLSKGQFPQNVIAMALNLTLIKRTLRRSDHIIATSQYYIDTSPLLKQHMEKVSTVPPGVDIDLFNPHVSSASLRSKYHGEPVILYVGAVSLNQQHKGVDTLINAFALLRKSTRYANTHLVIVGAGNAIDTYRKLSAELLVDGYVEFTGFIENDTLAQYYKYASVLTMPSRDRSEGFGMVFIEAGATGTPVIGTDVGGIPYAIQRDKTGLIVSPDNPHELKKAFESILLDSTLAQRLGKAGASRARSTFNWSLLAAKTAETFTRVAQPPIVQIAGYYPPSIGGMERVAQAVSELLAARGHAVTVLTSNINQPHNAPSTPLPNLTIKRLAAFEFAHTAFAPGFIPALCGVPRRSILHLHLSQAFYPEWTLVIASIRRIPYVVHFHLDLQPSGPLGVLFVLYKALVIRTVIKHADAVIVFSAEQRAFIHTVYGVTREKIIIIPNGVSSEYFVDTPRQLPKASPSLLYVGRISSQKRVGILTRAVSKTRNPVRLTIVGDGEERTETENAIPRKLRSSITFTGQLAPSETVPYFKKSDAFVMASKIEGMPLSVLEAMAAGLPIVGANVPGITELVTGVGILVDMPTPEAFADTIDTLFANRTLYEQLSHNSLKQAARLSWSTLIEKLEQLYKDVARED